MSVRINKSLAVVALICTAFISCKHKGKGAAAPESDDHLPIAVMQKVLLDVNMAEAYSIVVKDSLHKGGSKNTDSLPGYYKDIFTHYHITEAQFTNSMTWYKNHPEDMDSMYSHILPIATALQSQSPQSPQPVRK